MSDNSISSFPEEAQKIIRELREEAAAHRVAKQEAQSRVRELETELESLTSLQDEHEQLLSAHASLESAQSKLTTLLDAGYSGPVALELSNRVQGENPDEWKADAEKLSKLFTPPADEKKEEEGNQSFLDPSAGSATPLNADPTIAKLESIFGA